MILVLNCYCQEEAKLEKLPRHCRVWPGHPPALLLHDPSSDFRVWDLGIQVFRASTLAACSGFQDTTPTAPYTPRYYPYTPYLDGRGLTSLITPISHNIPLLTYLLSPHDPPSITCPFHATKPKACASQSLSRSRLAVKELTLSSYIGQTLLFTICTY